MGCRMERAKVAVARVSCILRVSAAGEAATDYFCWGRVLRIFSAEIAIKHEKNRVSEHPQIRAPVETLARGLKIYAIGCFTRHAGKCAAADPEGFAHSAAAEGRRERRSVSAAGRLQAMAGLVVAWKCRCGSSLAHISDRTCYKTR